MAEASRSQVTITLGRSGQVVKRAGSGMNGYFAEESPVVGSKRSVRDRLGSNVDSSGGFNNKRFRGDARNSNAHDESHLSKDDLRHKIKKKHIQRQSRNGQQNALDLRNILSRPANPPTNITVTRHWMPEPKDAGPSYRKLPYPKEQQQYIGTVDRGKLVPQTRNSDQHREEYRSQNVNHPREQRMSDTRVSIRRSPDLEHVRHNFSEPNSSSVMDNVSGPRDTNTMNKVDSRFKPHSPWTMEQLRRRSPDESLPTRTLQQFRRRSPAEALPTTRTLQQFRRRSPDEAFPATRTLQQFRQRSPDEAFLATRTLQQFRRRSPDEALPTTSTMQQFRRRSPDEVLPTTRTLQQFRRRSPDEALPTTRNLQQFRQKSTDEALPTTRGLSAAAARSDEELLRRYNVRTYDDGRAINMSRDAFDFSRNMPFSSGLTKTAPPIGSVRTLSAPAIAAPQLPQPSTLAQRGAYVQLDDNVTVDSLLKLLSLERYSILFKAEEVDMYSLKRMTEADLKEMGVPMGPRKKILLALQPRLRRQA